MLAAWREIVHRVNLETEMNRKETRTRVLIFRTILMVGCGAEPGPPPFEVVEPHALEMIDFEKLDPVIIEFIDSSKKHEVIGRPISEYKDLLELALDSREDKTRFRTYRFVLPMNESARLANDKVIATGGVLYSPMLFVRVEKSTGKIGRVFVHRQGF